MFHPHSSWHPHYRILRNNWEQRTGLPVVSLQRTRIHLPRPVKAMIWEEKTGNMLDACDVKNTEHSIKKTMGGRRKSMVTQESIICSDKTHVLCVTNKDLLISYPKSNKKEQGYKKRIPNDKERQE